MDRQAREEAAGWAEAAAEQDKRRNEIRQALGCCHTVNNTRVSTFWTSNKEACAKNGIFVSLSASAEKPFTWHTINVIINLLIIISCTITFSSTRCIVSSKQRFKEKTISSIQVWTLFSSVWVSAVFLFTHSLTQTFQQRHFSQFRQWHAESVTRRGCDKEKNTNAV